MKVDTLSTFRERISSFFRNPSICEIIDRFVEIHLKPSRNRLPGEILSNRERISSFFRKPSFRGFLKMTHKNRGF